MSNLNLLKELLLNNFSFILTTHVNPDADAIGSELALYYILKKLGKKVLVINHSATPYNLEFLDDENVIQKFDVEVHQKNFDETEVIIFVDLNRINRVIKVAECVKNFKGIKICIDHHQDPENSFDYIFGDTKYSATGEIIYDFIEETNIVEIDYKIASLLYAAIMTDTGSFRYERTTPRLHRIVAELLETGVNPTEIYDKIYNQFNFSRIKLLGKALSTIELDSTGKIAYMVVTQYDQSTYETTEDDIDGFVSYCLSIKGVEIGILFYELKDGLKISFRSKGKIDVNKLAEEYGGGGHLNASGTRMFNVKIDDIKEKVISTAQKYIEVKNVV
ncbi:MAG: bifunctional oligoribonuclease/PAP phosphatase NrnA [Melioribacter sp.]|nr:bifunctional oligoribonuclease/PAP phosphatase NrnA [Melioribacter sp.]